MSTWPPAVKQISECFIKPKQQPEEHRKTIHLSSWDLAFLSWHYIQKGLLYSQPITSDLSSTAILDQLKDTLSLTLIHFHLLAGQLETHHQLEDGRITSLMISIDPTKGPGVRFIHAALEVTISDLLSPKDIPRALVYSLFDHHMAVNHDGHYRPLLTVQVTRLLDGIFIGFSMNHVCADGTSFWHFINSWSEIFMKKLNDEKMNNITVQCPLVPKISRPPIHTQWFMDGTGPIIKLPYSHPDEFITRFEAPTMLKERFFHFSLEKIRMIKLQANNDCGMVNKISSFQALTALVWRCITRARQVPFKQEVTCKLAINNRKRLHPPLSDNYFGNNIHVVEVKTTAGELLRQNLGWAAQMINKVVSDYTNKVVHQVAQEWLRDPKVVQMRDAFGCFDVIMGSSPRFDMYGNEFGMGKPVAVLSGHATKFDGSVASYPGREGDGSIDLEICLLPDYMRAFEIDQELIHAHYYRTYFLLLS